MSAEPASEPVQAVKGTQAVQRVIRILKAFDDDHTVWEAPALARTLGLTKATTSRMLGALECEGLVSRDASGGYRLGAELIVMGILAMRGSDLRRAARPALISLSERAGESTTLEILQISADGVAAMLVLDEVRGRHLVGVQQYTGRRLPVHATSTGKAVLAFSQEAVDALMNGPLERFTAATIIDVDMLLGDLQTIRARGFAVARDELELGLVALAAPVFGATGTTNAALSVVWPSIRFDPKRIDEAGALVREAATDVSRLMGYRPP